METNYCSSHKNQLTELQVIPSLGEKWPQKGEKSNHNEIYFITVINTFFYFMIN